MVNENSGISPIDNLRSDLNETKSLTPQQKAEADMALDNEIEPRIQQLAQQDQIDSESEENSSEIVTFFSDADTLLKDRASELRTALQSNQYGKQALAEVIAETEAKQKTASGQEADWNEAKLEGLKFLLGRFDKAKGSSQSAVSEAVESDPETRKVVESDFVKMRAVEVKKLDHKDKSSSSSLRLRSQTMHQMREKYGAKVYKTVTARSESIQSNGPTGTEWLQEEFTPYEQLLLESDALLTQEYIEKANTEDRDVLVSYGSEVRTEEIPKLKNKNVLQLAWDMAADHSETLSASVAHEVTLIRGKGRHVTISTVEVNMDRVTDCGLAGMVYGMKDAEDPPHTLAALEDGIHRLVSNMDKVGSRNIGLYEKAVADRYRLGFLIATLDRIVGSQDFDEDDLYALKIAINSLQNSSEISGVDPMVIIQEVEAHPDDYPLVVRQVLANEIPGATVDSHYSSALYGTQEERAALKQKLEAREMSEAKEVLNRTVLEVGPTMFGKFDRAKTASARMERVVKGERRVGAYSPESIKLRIIEEQTQIFILEDLARLYEDEGAITKEMVSILRDVRFNDNSSVRHILKSEEPKDDQRKKALALLYFAQLHINPGLTEIPVRELTDMRMSDGNPILQPKDFVNVHNICLARVDAANRALSEDAVDSDREIAGLYFRQMIHVLAEDHEAAKRYSGRLERYGGGEVKDIFEGLNILREGRFRQGSYTGVDVHYYIGGSRDDQEQTMYLLKTSDRYAPPVNSETADLLLQQNRNGKVDAIRNIVDPVMANLEIRLSTPTQEQEAAEGEPIKYIEVDPNSELAEYQAVFETLGLPNAQENIELLTLINDRSSLNYRYGKEAELVGFGSYSQAERYQILLDMFANAVERYRTDVANKSWLERESKIWEKHRSSTLNFFEEYQEQEGINIGRGYKGYLNAARSPEEFEKRLRVLIDTQMENTLLSELKQIDVVEDISKLRTGVISKMFTNVPDGTVGVGNLHSNPGRWNGYSMEVYPPRGEYKTTVRDATAVTSQDIYPEAGLVNQLIKHKVEGLRKLQSRLAYQYGEIDFESDTPPMDQRKEYRKIARVQGDINTLIKQLEARRISEEVLHTGLRLAREKKIEQLRAVAEGSSEKIPDGYKEALGIPS